MKKEVYSIVSGGKEVLVPMNKVYEEIKNGSNVTLQSYNYNVCRAQMSKNFFKYCDENNLEVPKYNKKGVTRVFIPEEVVKKLYDEYINGASLLILEIRSGYNSGTIKDRIKKYCIQNDKPSPFGRKDKNKKKPLPMDEIFESLNSGEKISDIAKNNSCSITTVKNRLKSYCLERIVEDLKLIIEYKDSDEENIKKSKEIL